MPPYLHSLLVINSKEAWGWQYLVAKPADGSGARIPFWFNARVVLENDHAPVRSATSPAPLPSSQLSN